MGTRRLRAALAAPSQRWVVLATLSLGWAVLQGARFLIPPLLPRIKTTLPLSSTEAGLAFTAFGLIYAVVQYPSGVASDRIGRGLVVLAGFATVAAGVALVGISVTPLLFLGAILVFGIGKGLFAAPTRTQVADLFPDTRGRALGIYAAGTDLGGLLAAGLAVVVLANFRWQAPFIPIAILLLVAAVGYAVYVPEPIDLGRLRRALGVGGAGGGQGEGRGGGLRSGNGGARGGARSTGGGTSHGLGETSPGVLARGRRARATAATTGRRLVATAAQRERLLAYAAFYFVVGGITNFYPDYLVEAQAVEPSVAGGSFALVFAVGLLTKPTAGALSDRLDRLAVSIGGLVLGAAGLAVIVLASGSLVLIWAGTVALALGYKTQFPIADVVVIEAAPEGESGGDLGAARGVFLAAAALGPAFVGVLADLGNYDLAFGALAGLFLLAAAVLGRQYRRS
jgi:MFS family permease